MQAIASVRKMVRGTQPSRFRSRLRIVAPPKTFELALIRGWKVVSEKSNLKADKRHRLGSVALVLAGQPKRLSFPYTASTKAGFVFGTPQLM